MFFQDETFKRQETIGSWQNIIEGMRARALTEEDLVKRRALQETADAWSLFLDSASDLSDKQLQAVSNAMGKTLQTKREQLQAKVIVGPILAIEQALKQAVDQNLSTLNEVIPGIEVFRSTLQGYKGSIEDRIQDGFYEDFDQGLNELLDTSNSNNTQADFMMNEATSILFLQSMGVLTASQNLADLEHMYNINWDSGDSAQMGTLFEGVNLQITRVHDFYSIGIYLSREVLRELLIERSLPRSVFREINEHEAELEARDDSGES